MKITFLSIFCFLLFLSCNQSDKNNHATQFAGQAMTVPYRIVIGNSLDRSDKDEIRLIIDQTFHEIDEVYNKWNPRSEISGLNQAQAHQKIKLSNELATFLNETGHFVTLTNGKFDPTIEAVQKIWKHSFNNGTLPNSLDVKTAAEAVGWNKIHLENGYFWKEHDQLEIDLGGIAKGYAIDLLTERLNQAGYANVYVEWGGEIRTSGKHPEQRPWKIAVSADGSQAFSSGIALVEMHDEAVATSGDYFQKWTVDAITYFHIINPTTCCPLEAKQGGICSTTVVAPNCMIADVLATAAMLFDTKEEAEQWLEGLKDGYPTLQYWIMTR